MALNDLLAALDNDPQLRAQLMYFPERLAERYGLNDLEAAAIKSGDISALGLSAEDADRIRRKLNYHGI